jgi:hypothetical protein
MQENSGGNVVSYETTEVPVAKSQQKLRELLLRNKGGRVALISDPPAEGFQAVVPIDGKDYTIKIMATCKPKYSQSATEQEERRVWRVLFHHMKAIFEASKSGVMEFREMMLPYIVTNDGRTVAQCIMPQLDAALANRPERLLPAAREE